MVSPSFDSTRGAPSRLDEPTVELVRAALRRCLREGVDSPPLRAALGTLTARARERGVLPEQLVVLIKELWSTMPEVRVMHGVGDQVRMQQAIVTLCIKEYYSS